MQSIDKISTLDQLLRVQLAFRNRFNQKAVKFVCGDQASDCAGAFRNWLGPLPRSFSQLVRDGTANKWGDHSNLGYHVDSSLKEL